MKLGLLASAAAVVLGTQTASAQPVIVQPAYAPGITIGGTVFGRGGVAIGGTITTAPPIYAAPAYAGPVFVPPPVVVARPLFVPPIVVGRPYGYYGRGYYGPHHHRRW
ncbi:MAG TPA: hypothetical protein VN641_20670 [Urbifossiella sp.]|jgi:hypothetical protein|nr:hypothetical protein [Urbifossiella sp.]